MFVLGETLFLLLFLCEDSVLSATIPKHVKSAALNYHINTQENYIETNGKGNKVDVVASKTMQRKEDKHKWEEGIYSKLYGHLHAKFDQPISEKVGIFKIPMKHWALAKRLKQEFGAALSNQDDVAKRNGRNTSIVQELGDKLVSSPYSSHKDSVASQNNVPVKKIEEVIQNKEWHYSGATPRYKNNTIEKKSLPWKKLLSFIGSFKPSHKSNEDKGVRMSSFGANPFFEHNKSNGLRSTLQSKFSRDLQVNKHGQIKTENERLSKLHERAQRGKPISGPGFTEELRNYQESPLNNRNKVGENGHRPKLYNEDAYTGSIGNRKFSKPSWQAQKSEIYPSSAEQEGGVSEDFGGFPDESDREPLYLPPDNFRGVSSKSERVGYQPSDERKRLSRFLARITAVHPRRDYVTSVAYNNYGPDTRKNMRYSFSGYNKYSPYHIFGILTEEVTEEELLELFNHRNGFHTADSK